MWPIKDKQPAQPAGCLAGEVLVNGVCRFPAPRIEVPVVDRCGVDIAHAHADIPLVFAMIFARLFVCR